MQLISGMNLSAYWLSNYIFDTAKAMIPVLMTIGMMYAFKIHVIRNQFIVNNMFIV